MLIVDLGIHKRGDDGVVIWLGEEAGVSVSDLEWIDIYVNEERAGIVTVRLQGTPEN
jgi:hypothetical protein